MGGIPIKVAVVGKEEMIEDWRHSEKITRDYGMEVFVISEYEKAVAWLMNDCQ